MPVDEVEMAEVAKLDRTDSRKPKDRENSNWRGMLQGILVVLGVATAWVSSTQFSKAALLIDKHYFFAPYFMMWLNTSWMMSCFPIFLLCSRVCGQCEQDTFLSNFSALGRDRTAVFLRVLLFLCLWSGANYSYLRALGHVSASVATSISSCNVAIVYILSILLLSEIFIAIKLLSVFLAIAGVVLISMDGQISAELIGVLLAVLSATFAAFYKVFFKRIFGDASLGQVALFMSLLGLLNFFLNSIPAFGLVLFGVEILDVAHVPWLPLLGSGILNLVFNFLINFGIALLHPLVVSIGMLTGLPLNTAVDVLLGRMSASLFFLSGSALVICSFIIIIIPPRLLFSLRHDPVSTADSEIPSSP